MDASGRDGPPKSIAPPRQCHARPAIDCDTPRTLESDLTDMTSDYFMGGERDRGKHDVIDNYLFGD